MNDRKYVKVNTSIQTGSNASRLSYDSEGNVKAVIDLNLPADLFPEKNGPKKIDSVAMQTSKMRLSMENLPIAQLPVDQDLTQHYNRTVAEGQLDVYPFTYVKGKVDTESNLAFPNYKEHKVNYRFYYYALPDSLPDLLETVEVVANAEGFGFPKDNRFYSLVYKAKLDGGFYHMMNLIVQNTREKERIEDGQLMIRNISTLQQMLQDGIENAITFASSKSNITVDVALLDSEYSGEVSPTPPDPSNTVYLTEVESTAVYWKSEVNNNDSTRESDLLYAVKPQVKIGTQSLTISYDTAPFTTTVPIFWNTSYVNTHETAGQLTLDSFLHEMWDGEPPPKRFYKYGVSSTSSGYNFTINPEIQCALMNLIANKSLRDTFSFLPWIEVDAVAAGIIPKGVKAPKYLNLEVEYKTEQDIGGEVWTFGKSDKSIPNSGTTFTYTGVGGENLNSIWVQLKITKPFGDDPNYYYVCPLSINCGTLISSSTFNNSPISAIHTKKARVNGEARTTVNVTSYSLSDTANTSSKTKTSEATNWEEGISSWDNEYYDMRNILDLFQTNLSKAAVFNDQGEWKNGIPFASYIQKYFGTSNINLAEFSPSWDPVLAQHFAYLPDRRWDTFEITDNRDNYIIANIYFNLSGDEGESTFSVRRFDNVKDSVLHQEMTVGRNDVTNAFTQKETVTGTISIPLNDVNVSGSALNTGSAIDYTFNKETYFPSVVQKPSASAQGFSAVTGNIHNFVEGATSGQIIMEYTVPTAFYDTPYEEYYRENIKISYNENITDIAGILPDISPVCNLFITQDEVIEQTDPNTTSGTRLRAASASLLDKATLISETFSSANEDSASASNISLDVSPVNPEIVPPSASIVSSYGRRGAGWMAWFPSENEEKLVPGYVIPYGHFARNTPLRVIPPFAYSRKETVVVTSVETSARIIWEINKKPSHNYAFIDVNTTLSGVATKSSTIARPFSATISTTNVLDEPHQQELEGYKYLPNLNLSTNDQNKFYILDGTASEVTIGPQEPVDGRSDYVSQTEVVVDKINTSAIRNIVVDRSLGIVEGAMVNWPTISFRSSLTTTLSSAPNGTMLFKTTTTDNIATMTQQEREAAIVAAYIPADLVVANDLNHTEKDLYTEANEVLTHCFTEPGYISSTLNPPAYISSSTSSIPTKETTTTREVTYQKTYREPGTTTETVTSTESEPRPLYEEDDGETFYDLEWYVDGQYLHTKRNSPIAASELRAHPYLWWDMMPDDPHIARITNTYSEGGYTYQAMVWTQSYDPEVTGWIPLKINMFNKVATPVDTYDYSTVWTTTISDYVPDPMGNLRISFTWDNLPMVVLSPISSIVLSLTGMDVQQEYQPINMTEVGGSSLTSSIPVIENYFSLAQTLRDLHDELVVVKEQFDTTATYTLSTQSGQERSLTLSAHYISKDGKLHQIYIPPNGVFAIQLTFAISYYYSS